MPELKVTIPELSVPPQLIGPSPFAKRTSPLVGPELVSVVESIAPPPESCEMSSTRALELSEIAMEELTDPLAS